MTTRHSIPSRPIRGAGIPACQSADRDVCATMIVRAALAIVLLLSPAANAADLVLAADGKSDYQIVVPDAAPSPAIAESLTQTARLAQTAFKANGFETPVVAEAKRDPAKPGIYLGDTALARDRGVEVALLKGWSYVHKVIGRDLIIAGRDHPAPSPPKGNRPRTGWDRVGTAKAVADFLREFVGTRFLYPDLRPWSSLKNAADLDLLSSPAFEFLPTAAIAVPRDLDARRTPHLEFNTAYPRRGSFYDIANNRFPLVDTVFGGHTYARAIPPSKYRETHPKYFALVGGQRLLAGHGQYCISNPEVQELIYQDLIGWLDRGYETVDLGQPDGFRACQCENCEELYGTGSDWSEKLWIFHRKLAERVLAARPGKQVSMISYILTGAPPKTFKVFPKNTRIMWCGTNEEDLARWSEHEVPAGFTSYVYNWCANLCSRYTPMRTPAFVEAQARRLVRNNIRGIYRDGPGALCGLEGPVYYIMGRMFDDPESNQAKDLMHEFCGAAFGRAAGPMLRFYDQLYHGIELYSQYLATRAPAWTYRNIYGRRRKHLSDPFQLLGFLYTPRLLASLEGQLRQAEKAADTEKVKARLALVRREFDYVRSLARVVHLHHAYQIQPDLDSRDRLLDAIDARNAEIDGYYGVRRRVKTAPGWSFVMFPPGGHDAKHLRLAYNRYQEPFENTPLNWDTKAMRKAPLPGAKRLAVRPAQGAVTMDAPQWERATANELSSHPGHAKVTRKTVLRVLYDEAGICLRVESELPAPLMKPDTIARDGDLSQQESLDIYLAPQPGREICYRFMVGLRAESRHDAAIGLITDAMDPRHGKFDPDWNGEWTYETQLQPEKNRWLALLRIPFRTLGIEPPAPEAFWRGNVGRIHVVGPDQIQHSALSANPQTKGVADRDAFAEFVFRGSGSGKAPQPAKNPLEKWREEYYRTTFEIPAEWKKLSDPSPLRLDTWLFRTDPIERGVKERWHATKVTEADWLPMRVPSFWAENADVGNYQGYGWYRTTFKLPAEWKGRTLRLLFASVDEQAWVYVNGRLVREHTEKSEGKPYGELWESPFTADVPPEHLEFGKPNVLTVRVHNSKANGGIWRPVLAHAPR